MTRVLAIVAVAVAAFAVLSVGAQPQNQPTDVHAAVTVTHAPVADQRLADIKRIYVGSLGSAEGSDLIRQKVINRLVKISAVTVVESPEDADATLTGAAEVDHRHYLYSSGYSIHGGTKFSAQGAVRLVGRNKQILWTDETGSSCILSAAVQRLFGSGVKSIRSSSANLADKIVKSLTDAIAADRNQIASR